MSLYALLVELNLLFAVSGATFALVRTDELPGRRTYAMLALATAAWCAGELLARRDLLEAWLALRLSMLGLVLVGPLWLGVAVHMAQLPISRRLPWFPVPLAAPGLLLWLLLFLEPWSAAVMSAPDEPGPLWWVFTPYAYALILAGSALQVASGARRGGPLGHRSIVIGLAGLLPLGVHAAWTWFGLPGERDPTPLTLGPVGLALASALFPGGLLEVRPLAQHELIERLPIGVVMAYRDGAVFDVNAQAERALALSRAELIGRSLDAIVAEAPSSHRVEISEVTLASRLMARFAFLHPPDGATQERQDAA